MNAIAQTEFNPSLAVINGTIKTTSLKVAEHFGKQHKSVLRSINNLECSTDFIERNFAPIQFDVEVGFGIRKDTAYEMTKDGFTFLAMGFTGKEAAKWKEAYINAFNKMAEQLSSNPVQLEPKTITKAQQGILFNVVAGKSDHSGKSRSYYWSRFANHFKLASYKDLRAELFDEAHHYLQGLEGEEMLYITISELNRVVDSNIKRAIEGQLVEKQSKNSLTIDMRFPEGMRTMNMQFETSEFQHGRWLVSLMDGNLSIQAMPNDVLCLTTDKWIDYMTQERGYVVGKKLN